MVVSSPAPIKRSSAAYTLTNTEESYEKKTCGVLQAAASACYSLSFHCLWLQVKKAKNLPDNYIVLSNHATDLDPLFVVSSFPRDMYFVASEHIARWPFAYKLLKFAFKPILRYKGASGAAAVLEILRHLKNGANVALFAEGVRTWDGVTCPILPSTGKLIRSAGCGLVTYKITGGYFASPMWAGSKIRRGHICGAPVNVYTKEQLKAMNASEVYNAIIFKRIP